MLNMLKYQFYRLTHNLSTYIALFLIALFDIMIVEMNAAIPGSLSGEEAIANFMTATQMASFSFVSMAVPIVYSTWAVIFAYGEFQQGYIRNIASSTNNKISFFFGHMTVCAVMFIAFAIVSCISTIISSKLMIPDIETGDFVVLFKILSMQLYFHLAYAALALLGVYFFRNIFIPLVMTFAVSMGIEPLPLIIVQNLIEKTLGEKGAVLNSWLNSLSITNNIFNVELSFYSGKGLEKHIIMGGVILLIYSTLACLAITKKDIK